MHANPGRRRSRLLVQLVLFSAAVSAFGQEYPGFSDAPIGTEGDRSIHESVVFDKLGNRRTDAVYRMEFSLGTGRPVFEGADHFGTGYVLTDGTYITQNRSSGSRIFVSQVFEHRNAMKTVVLVPAIYTDLDGSYEKFLIFQDLVSRNPEKSVFVLLEGVDSGSPRIDEFVAIRAHTPKIDFYHAVTAPFAYHVGLDTYRAAISPSMALFYDNTEVMLRGLAETGALAPYPESRRDEERERIISEKEKIANGLSEVSEAFNSAQVYKLAVKLEHAITAAVNEIGKPDREIVERINALQIELAEGLLAPDIATQVFEGYDQNLRALAASIDGLCDAGAVEEYERFIRAISDFRAVVLEIEAGSMQRIGFAEADGPSADEVSSRSSLLISEAFSGLPEGSLAICELSADRIDEQILHCLKQADYNLVLFNLPYREAHLEQVRHAQDPAEHKISPGLTFPLSEPPEIHLPPGFSRTVEANARVRQLLLRKLSIFRYAYRESDRLLDGDRVLIHYFNIPDLGGIVRTTTVDDGEIRDLYFFLPGRELEDQIRSVKESYQDEAIPELSRLILEKWAQMTRAFLGL